MTTSNATQAADFGAEIHAFEAQIANARLHLAIDSAGHAQYGKLIKAMLDELRAQAGAGKITWARKTGIR